MQENTNKAIAYNSLVLYVKMAITTVCALLSTRFGLQALGVVDYGLYAVLGGIISIIAIVNTIMVSTSNRFIAVAIGRGNMEEANKQFNVNLSIHVAIALLVLIVAYPIGDWYIHRYVNYDGPVSNAMMVYGISIVGSALSFIGVPYHGLLMAKEKFVVFSAMEVFSHVVRLIVTWVLVYHFSQKLLIYTLAFAVLHALPAFFYMFYCSRHYNQIVRVRLVRDKGMYRDVFNFSAWVGVGALAHVARNQGAALIVNAFFNTVMNTAMGVASMVNNYVRMFATSITQPIAPQITKSFAIGNRQRTDELLIMSTKYCYLLTLMIGSVFLAAPQWILSLWLGEVPPFSTIFLTLFIIDNLVLSLNEGVGNIIFASGKVGLYQICSSAINILAVVSGYFVLRGGSPAYYLLVAYISVSTIRFFVIQWALHRTLNYNSRTLWRYAYLPSFLTTLLFVPVLIIPFKFHPIVKVVITFLYLCLLVWFVGLSKTERFKLMGFVRGKFVKEDRNT